MPDGSGASHEGEVFVHWGDTGLRPGAVCSGVWVSDKPGVHSDRARRGGQEAGIRSDVVLHATLWGFAVQQCLGRESGPVAPRMDLHPRKQLPEIPRQLVSVSEAQACQA
jgi:hypothetical protein